MRYQVLKPTKPVDIRHQAFAGEHELFELCPVVLDCHFEAEAAQSVRTVLPEAVACPFPIRIGTGTSMVIGFCDEMADRDLDPNDEIPFVIYVRAIPERGRDHRREFPFNKSIWKPPVHRATAATARPHEVEVRADELDMAVVVPAIVGRIADGRLVVTIEVHGKAFSLAFSDTQLELGPTSDGDRKMPSNVGIGASFDPNAC